MTPEQEKQFNLYGCGPRCLIKLAELQGKTITKANIVDKFAPQCSLWSQQCGLAPTSLLCDTARHFGLCTFVDTHVNQVVIKRRILSRQTRGVIVSTDRHRDAQGQLGDLFHYRLLIEWQTDRLILWHSNQDGREFTVPVLQEEFDEQLPHFLVFL
jgi:hypothetical protein